MEPALRAFRTRGGHVAAIVGIDENGATRQGIALLRELSDDLRIFHDPHGGTFHPKLYLFTGGERAYAIVGSANSTRGGLFDNYEASSELELALPEDADVLTEITGWIDGLRSEDELCLAATDELVAVLDAAGRLLDEDRDRGSPSDDSSAKLAPIPFGLPGRPKVRAPVRPAARQAAGAKTEPAAAQPAQVVTAASTPPELDLRWYKELSASDAQRPPQGGTNVTGLLRLTRADFDLDWRTFFRDHLFSRGRWQKSEVSGQPAERATIPFSVTIAGTYIGVHELVVDHAPHREAGQANVTTVLHWGSLSPRLRDSDYSGYWVLLETTSDGRYGLTIQKQKPANLGG